MEVGDGGVDLPDAFVELLAHGGAGAVVGAAYREDVTDVVQASPRAWARRMTASTSTSSAV
jgi:hypothetical protein